MLLAVLGGGNMNKNKSNIMFSNKGTPSHPSVESKGSTFKKKVVLNSALACNNIIAKDFDVNQAKTVTEQSMTALDIHGGLQTMLAAQMLSIHNLQQRAMAYANGITASGHETEQYYTNTAIKLANCFVQQASLLAKLQGMGGQQVIVKPVEINQGGQAIVGNVGDLAQHKAEK